MRASDASVEMRAVGDLVRYPRAFWDTPEYERTRTTTEVLLPSGAATREDFVREPGTFGELAAAIYTLAAPDGVAWLMCGAKAPPADSWLSIAESVEFMPAVAPVADDDAKLTCPESEEPLRGLDPRLDREYLTHCVTCEELLARLEFRRVPDMGVGLAVFSERCDQANQIPWAYEEWPDRS